MSDMFDDCYGCHNEIIDWKEEYGWNDVYGVDVNAAEIIEFRD